MRRNGLTGLGPRVLFPVKLVFGVVVLSLISAAAAAPDQWGEKAFAVSPAQALRLAESFKPDGTYDAVVLFRELRYSYDNLGRLVYSDRLIYQIRSASALEGWGALEETWAPWRQERPVLRARVINPDGRAHWLEKKTIDEAPASTSDPSIHDDNMTLRAPLPALTVGSVVEEELTIKGTKPFFAAGDARDVYFSYTVPAQFVRLIVETAPGTTLRSAVRLLPDAKKTEADKGGGRRLVVEAGSLPAQEDHLPGLPSDAPRYPHVCFSTGRSWQELTAAYHEAVQAQLPDSGLGPLAHRLSSGAGNDRAALIEAFATYVKREIRYTGLEFGRAGLIPERPDKTIARKYGDCKDKAAVLVALLHEVGIDARLALLSAAWGEDVEPSLPGLGIFNHAIVYVPGSPDLWIDATDEYGPWADLPEQCEGRLALIVDPTTVELRKTPESQSTDNRVYETRVFDLAESGPARVTETSVAYGDLERTYRSYYASAKPEDIKKTLENYVGSTYLAKSLETFEYSKPGDGPSFTLKLVADKAARGTTGKNDAAVAIRLESLVSRLPDDLLPDAAEEQGKDAEPGKKPEPKKREYDYVLSAPHVVEWAYEINFPPGFRLANVPPSRTQQLGPATVSYEFGKAPEGACVKGKIRLDTGKRRLTPDELENFKAALKDFQKQEPLLIMFDNIAETALAAGKGREAVAELRRLIEIHPKEALHHIQLSEALLSYGLREAAVKEATTATELEPASAPAWRALAWALEHDSIGRRFVGKFDYAGAESAYRKAIEADPDDVDAQALLAVLLEHDPTGKRYAAESRLSEAIELYEKLGDKLDGGGMADNLAFALMRAGRYQELADLLKRKKRSQAAQAMELVAIAKLQGYAAALSKAYAISDQQTRSLVIRQATNMLLQLSSYSDAAALFTAAAQGLPNASQMLAVADRMRKTRSIEEVMKDENSPVNVSRQALCWMLDGQFSKEAAPRIFSRHSLEKVDSYARKARTSMTQTLSSIGALSLPIKAMTEISLAVMDFVPDGDGEVVLIRMSALGAKGGRGYVTKEKDGYRVLATATCLGREVVSRIEQGDLDSAKKLLDWASEDQNLLADQSEESPRYLSELWNEKTDKTKVENMRIAAASLADKQSMKESQEILREALAASKDPDAREKLSDVLASLIIIDKDYEGLAKFARQMRAEFKKSERAELLLLWALVKLTRWPEYEQELRLKRKEEPDDLWTIRGLSDAAREQGRLQECWDLLKGLVDKGKAEAVDYNNLAWTSLLLGSVGESDFEYAQKSVTLEKRRPEALHTLACLYAESEKTTEARDVIREAIEAREGDEAGPSDWYVVARIAEGLGMTETAIPIYERVLESLDSDLSSVQALAKRRLGVLKAVEKPAK